MHPALDEPRPREVLQRECQGPGGDAERRSELCETPFDGELQHDGKRPLLQPDVLEALVAQRVDEP